MVNFGKVGIKETKLMNNLIEVGLGILEKDLIRSEETEILHKNAETLCDLMIDIFGVDKKDYDTIANFWRSAYTIYLNSLIPVLERLKKDPRMIYSVAELTIGEAAKYFEEDKEERPIVVHAYVY